MMQEDSNGESSFEFVNKKVDDLTLLEPNSSRPSGEIPAPPPAAPVNILSSVPPPSALPSFVMAPVLTSEAPAAPSPTMTSASGAVPTRPQISTGPVSSQPQLTTSYPAPTFSAAIPQPLDAASEVPPSPQDEQGGSLLGWMKGAVGSGGILSRVAEKAKSSVDSMITTLDPQMKEFIYSGGDMDIVVASDKEVKISPIREAFQSVFGRATVTGQEAQSSMVAAQPVGFAAGTRAAEERITAVRKSGSVPDAIPVVAVENFLLEVSEEKWFDLGVLVLEDSARKISLHTFTQLTPVPARVVERAQADTPSDYSLRWSGFAVPIGKLMAEHLQVGAGEWHQALSGVTRRDMLLLSAKSLAGLYKSALDS